MSACICRREKGSTETAHGKVSFYRRKEGQSKGETSKHTGANLTCRGQQWAAIAQDGMSSFAAVTF